MKQVVSYLLSCILLFTVFFFAPTNTQASGSPQIVAGTATSVVTGPDTASGNAKFVIGSKSYTATFSIVFAIMPPDANGVSQTVSSHIFTVKDSKGRAAGTFTTSDKGVLRPVPNKPGFFTLSNDLKIVSGTGSFSNTKGDIHTENLLDFNATPPTGSTVLFGLVTN